VVAYENDGKTGGTQGPSVGDWVAYFTDHCPDTESECLAVSHTTYEYRERRSVSYRRERVALGQYPPSQFCQGHRSMAVPCLD
jgi:hypothetical protein